MNYLLLVLAGTALGASAMYVHHCSVNRAILRERERSDRREDRLRSERDNYINLYKQAVATIEQLHLDQANSAGYEDGWHACYNEVNTTVYTDSLSDVLKNSLHNGKTVRMSVVNP